MKGRGEGEKRGGEWRRGEEFVLCPRKKKSWCLSFIHSFIEYAQ